MSTSSQFKGTIGRTFEDSKLGEGDIPRTVKYSYGLDETFDIGIDTATPVTDEYKANARFTGTINKVVIDLAGKPHIDAEKDAKIVMKRQ